MRDPLGPPSGSPAPSGELNNGGPAPGPAGAVGPNGVPAGAAPAAGVPAADVPGDMPADDAGADPFAP